MGLGEQTHLAALAGTGERAAGVAEQLALQQGFRKGSAVHHDEGPPSGAGVVYAMGEELLARSSLPGDQDVEVGLRVTGRHPDAFPDALAGSDDVSEGAGGRWGVRALFRQRAISR